MSEASPRSRSVPHQPPGPPRRAPSTAELVAAIVSDLFQLENTLAGLVGQSQSGAFREATLSSIRQLDEVVLHLRRIAARHHRLEETLDDVSRDNAALERDNSAKTDLLAMIGHDISTPLAVLLSYVEVLAADDPATDQLLALRRARAAGRQTRTLLDSVLAMTASETSELLTHPEPLDLVADAPDLLDAIPGGEKVRLDIRPGAGEATFDRGQLTQILGNLIANAFRYGSEPVTLTVVPRTGSTTLLVSDAGPGLTDRAQERLFERFAPAPHPTTGTLQGTGLGLYLAQRLALANGAVLDYRPGGDERPHAFAVTIPR